MPDSKKIIKEKAFSVGYNRPDWLISEHVRGALLKKYNSTRIEVFEARVDNALFRHTVSGPTAKESITVTLYFKRGSMVIFDAANHYMYYYSSDLMKIQ